MNPESEGGTMQSKSSADVVRAWLDAANAQDLGRLAEISAPDIELIGPRGSGHGHHVLRDWLGRAGLSLEARRAFARGEVVVVAQHGVWRSAETGDVIGEADVATLFRTDGQRVVQVSRFDGLDDALRSAGLDYQDETSTR